MKNKGGLRKFVVGGGDESGGKHCAPKASRTDGGARSTGGAGCIFGCGLLGRFIVGGAPAGLCCLPAGPSSWQEQAAEEGVQDQGHKPWQRTQTELHHIRLAVDSP